jgi:hypothetical protein
MENMNVNTVDTIRIGAPVLRNEKGNAYAHERLGDVTSTSIGAVSGGVEATPGSHELAPATHPVGAVCSPIVSGFPFGCLCGNNTRDHTVGVGCHSRWGRVPCDQIGNKNSDVVGSMAVQKLLHNANPWCAARGVVREEQL